MPCRQREGAPARSPSRFSSRRAEVARRKSSSFRLWQCFRSRTQKMARGAGSSPPSLVARGRRRATRAMPNSASISATTRRHDAVRRAIAFLRPPCAPYRSAAPDARAESIELRPAHTPCLYAGTYVPHVLMPLKQRYHLNSFITCAPRAEARRRAPRRRRQHAAGLYAFGDAMSLLVES